MTEDVMKNDEIPFCLLYLRRVVYTLCPYALFFKSYFLSVKRTLLILQSYSTSTIALSDMTYLFVHDTSPNVYIASQPPPTSIHLNLHLPPSFPRNAPHTPSASHPTPSSPPKSPKSTHRNTSSLTNSRNHNVPKSIPIAYCCCKQP